jgi:hypothetical protein
VPFGIARHWHPVLRIYMISAHVDVALVAAGRRDQRFNKRSFIVG